MADVRAFQGLQFNPAKVKNLADVITPPYDVISPEQKADFLKKSPWNVVRLILPEGEDPYAGANQLLQSWVEQGVFIHDSKPAVYCYHQTFQTPEGEEKTRKGFLARLKLEDFEKGIVLPHEATLSAPKEDRLRLLRACKTNFSPIFGIYSDPEHKIDSLLDRCTGGSPQFQVLDDGGVTNSIWSIHDQSVLQEVGTQMKTRWVLIADGHHRYESCLLYRNEMRVTNPDPEAPFEFTLMFFTNIHHPGITVLPYNRGVMDLPNFQPDQLLRKASKYFEIREFDEQEFAIAALKKEGSENTAFLALLRGAKDLYLFKLKKNVRLGHFYPPQTPEAVQRLDVNILHKIFLQEILSISEEDVRQQSYLKYYKDIKEEVKDFEAGRLQIAFFLNPTRVNQVVEVSRAGAKMPQKSTFFYPKLMTGFVMNQH